MSDDTYNELFSSGSGPGILYGLPKIHKVDFAHKFQLRPIEILLLTTRPHINLLTFWSLI